jgi:hypothetical protein
MVDGVRLLFAAAFLAAGLTLGTQRVQAETLDLLGVGWEKSEVTVQIKAAGGVTSQAILDVAKAIDDWNAVLEHIHGAPQLVQVSGVKKADITTQMKVGGGATLGSAGSRTISPFACELSSASIQLSGKAFGEAFISVVSEPEMLRVTRSATPWVWGTATIRLTSCIRLSKPQSSLAMPICRSPSAIRMGWKQSTRYLRPAMLSRIQSAVGDSSAIHIDHGVRRWGKSNFIPEDGGQSSSPVSRYVSPPRWLTSDHPTN